MPDRAVRFLLKPLAFLASLGPAAWLGWAVYAGSLSANPLRDLTNETGVWTLRFLCITLSITPLRKISGWNGAIRFRRMAGLYAFFYGTLHLLTYVVADRFAGLDVTDGIFSWGTVINLARAVWDDVSNRPFITVGFTAWAAMAPLTVTSTAGMIRRLGGRRWNRLHSVVYATVVLGVVHYWWLVKADIRRPLTYAAVVFVLLAFRVHLKRGRTRPLTAERREPAARRDPLRRAAFESAVTADSVDGQDGCAGLAFREP
jgi:methionine sulfoxide reductase heme-binding subunit